MSFAYSYAFTLFDITSKSQHQGSGLMASSPDIKLATKQPALNFCSMVEKLNIINKAFQEELEINLFFLSPAIPVEAKKQALKKVFNSLNYKGLICSFLYLLLDKKKWHEWSAVLKHLNNIKEESLGFLPVEVESTSPLSDDLKEKLIQKLNRFLGKQVQVQEKLNPHLVGGIKIRAGGFVFDDSLSYHLKRMGNI